MHKKTKLPCMKMKFLCNKSLLSYMEMKFSCHDFFMHEIFHEASLKINKERALEQQCYFDMSSRNR